MRTILAEPQRDGWDMAKGGLREAKAKRWSRREVRALSQIGVAEAGRCDSELAPAETQRAICSRLGWPGVANRRARRDMTRSIRVGVSRRESSRGL